MVIGHGDIAQVVLDGIKKGLIPDDKLYFASGVSNPNEVSEDAFLREKTLLLAQQKDIPIVYFSSLSVLKPEKKYAYHKLEMENLIIKHFPKYVIVRLGIISWGNNPYTTINFLKRKFKNNEPFTIRDTSRVVHDKRDFLDQLRNIPTKNKIVLLKGKLLTEEEIFKTYVI